MSLNEPIAITGRGCYLPGATHVGQFVDCLKQGSPLAQNLLKNSDYNFHQELELLYSKDRKAPNSTYCSWGVTFNQAAKELRDNKPLSETIVTSAIEEALKDASIHPVEKDLAKNIGLFMGFTSAFDRKAFKKSTLRSAEKFANENIKNENDRSTFLNEISKLTQVEYFPDNEFTTPHVSNTLSGIKTKYNINGPSAIVDAACASSLSTIYLSAKLLQDKELDIAVAGGFESCIGHGHLVLFSKVGALNENGPSMPFDKRSQGFTQGMGSVFFVLQRLSDAIEQKKTIYGVIEGIDGSSEGRSTSLVEPSVKGQLNAYQNAYGELSRDVDYVEAHGTGTEVGDRTELKSLGEFFPKSKTPVGSIKSIFGHTIGTAGSLGLLKALHVLETETVPANTYYKQPIKEAKNQFFINKKPVKLTPKTSHLRAGVSSFGFGGSNFHLVVSKYSKNYFFTPPTTNSDSKKVVLCGASHILKKDIGSYKEFDLGFPPNTVKKMDDSQILGLLATHKALKDFKVNINQIDLKDINVISTSSMGTERLWHSLKDLDYVMFSNLLKKNTIDFQDKKPIEDNLEKILEVTPKANEDTMTGLLNNIIAGRISNRFNFQGLNFNLESGENSSAIALKIAQQISKHKNKMTVVVSLEEEKNEFGYFESTGAKCFLLASEEFAYNNNLNILKELKTINFQPTQSHE